MFSGSYLDTDVEFLLEKVEVQELSLEEKEYLIQSGKKHYSEIISTEYEPSKEYLAIFYQAVENNSLKFAKDIFTLAKKISLEKDFVLVSLARAGIPVGVLLKRVLEIFFNINTKHYGVSIIRDKGLDTTAIKYILESNPNKKLIFIDGWTGKGIISKELAKSINDFNKKYKTNISSDLYVVSDISGKAYFSASYEDYLIPSAVLNSTISGLISRTILNTEKNSFHACKYYEHLKEKDLSLWFIDKIINEIKKYVLSENIDIMSDLQIIQKNIKKEDLVKISETFIAKIMQDLKISNINYIKPGIGETTRVLLRRIPEVIFIKDVNSLETKHLVLLSKEKSVKIIEEKEMPYKAVGIIYRLKEN
ncbi:MAG: cysteine protease StiP family protein [Candidatus Sericytochromatia bacterium]